MRLETWFGGGDPPLMGGSVFACFVKNAPVGMVFDPRRRVFSTPVGAIPTQKRAEKENMPDISKVETSRSRRRKNPQQARR